MKLKRIISTLLVFAILITALPKTEAYTSVYTESENYGTINAPYVTDYYEQLTPISRVVYDALLENAENMKSGTYRVEFDIPKGYDLANLDIDEVDFYSDAVAAFRRDHCEVFWVKFTELKLMATGNASRGWHAVLVPNGVNYLTDGFADREAVDRACEVFEENVKKLLEGAEKQMGKIMMLSYIHDRLIENNEYNHGDLANVVFESYSAIEGNHDGPNRPVCEGFSKAFKVLCDRMGIPCVCISGIGSLEGVAGPHMWNAVNVDGNWYGIDVTWDDGLTSISISNEFFMVGSDTEYRGKKFSATHKIDGYIAGNASNFSYPALSKDSYSDRNKAPDITKSPGMSNFEIKNNYVSGMFRDVSEKDWFAKNIKAAYEYDLTVGLGDGVYGVNSDLTIAQSLVIATKLHSTYAGNSVDVSGAVKWYDPYVAYCLENGIIDGPFDVYDAKATRAQFADILARSLPADELEAINTVTDGIIPDVDMEADYAANIYMLYRAGILAGNDDIGTFGPDTNILRCQVAAIITRMVDLSLRVNVNFE